MELEFNKNGFEFVTSTDTSATAWSMSTSAKSGANNSSSRIFAKSSSTAASNAAAPRLTRFAARNRTRRAEGSREVAKDLVEIDKEITQAGTDKLQQQDLDWLNVFRGGGAWCNNSLYHAGKEDQVRFFEM